MNPNTTTQTDEMARAALLPQSDASSLVDVEELDAKVKQMYGKVAREEQAELHFEIGRNLAMHLGYPRELLDAIPANALASFAGVGYHLGLAALAPGEAVLDLGCGSGTDVFCAAVQVGRSGLAVGVDFTRDQVSKAQQLRARDGFTQVNFIEGRIDALPFEDATFDVVISNGVINLSVVKSCVFGEGARVLRPGGRLALADIVSGKPLKEKTRRNVDLWAACIAGAIPRDRYIDTIEDAGFDVQRLQHNDYRFISQRALTACSTYAVQSVSLLARKATRR
jgi:ubiquinone/menaquinone biosynthesis C-methylase UbiE